MSPESITSTGSMDSGPAPSGASTMCNCTSGNPEMISSRFQVRASARPGMTVSQSPPHQLIGEIADGLAIDGGVIPFAHRLEIRGAFAVRRAVLEAVGVQEVGGGSQHVRHAVAQVDTGVAVAIRS